MPWWSAERRGIPITRDAQDASQASYGVPLHAHRGRKSPAPFGALLPPWPARGSARKPERRRDRRRKTDGQRSYDLKDYAKAIQQINKIDFLRNEANEGFPLFFKAIETFPREHGQ